MLLRRVLILALACAFPTSSHAQDPVPVHGPKTELVLVPGTRVRLAPPPGAEPGRGFLGYQWPESGASLNVLEMPGSYAEAVPEWDAKRLAKHGMKLLEASDVKLGVRDARLFLVTQESQGIRFTKWALLFGDETHTVILNAAFPEELTGELPGALKATLLGAQWDPKLQIDPFAVLPWSVATPEGLRFAGSMGAMLLYTEDGEMVQKDKPGSARFSVAPSMGEVKIPDVRAFAEQRIRQLPVGKSLAIETSDAFEAGGRKGWQITARARHEKEPLDLFVQQFVLVGPEGYHLFVGQCAYEQRATWLPRFRACASSWKVRDTAQGTTK